MSKVLIDECLSPELALMARERGHHEASHVVWIGKAGWKDWELKRVILEQDWVLVTATVTTSVVRAMRREPKGNTPMFLSMPESSA
jgi:predicted nuclease of predicted toxin-antitoxin system